MNVFSFTQQVKKNWAKPFGADGITTSWDKIMYVDEPRIIRTGGVFAAVTSTNMSIAVRWGMKRQMGGAGTYVAFTIYPSTTHYQGDLRDAWDNCRLAIPITGIVLEPKQDTLEPVELLPGQEFLLGLASRAEPTRDPPREGALLLGTQHEVTSWKSGPIAVSLEQAKEWIAGPIREPEKEGAGLHLLPRVYD